MEIYTNWIKSIYGYINFWIYLFPVCRSGSIFTYVGTVAYCVYKERKKHPWRY